MALACGTPLAPAGEDDSGGPGADCTPAADGGDDASFFDPTTVREVRITLSDEGRAALELEPRTYVVGDVEIDGSAYPSVGVRLKGNSSFNLFDGKPAFKIKLNEYCSGQLHAGLRRLTLNNMNGDATQSQEVVNYQIFGAAGLDAPRANYARVYLNEEFQGLYVNVESVDLVWLGRTFEMPEGDLWEAADSADFDAEHLAGWESREGAGDRAALQAVADDLLADGGVYDNLSRHVNMEQFLAYWSWKTIVGDDDGYPWNLNDLYIYGNPADGGRFTFHPWGFDEGWKDPVRWEQAPGALAAACAADEDCGDRLVTTLIEALDAFEAWDAMGAAEAAWALSEASVMEDARRPFTVGEVEDARVVLGAAIAGRAAVVRGRLD